MDRMYIFHSIWGDRDTKFMLHLIRGRQIELSQSEFGLDFQQYVHKDERKGDLGRYPGRVGGQTLEEGKRPFSQHDLKTTKSWQHVNMDKSPSKTVAYLDPPKILF